MKITANGVMGEVLHWTTTMQSVPVGDGNTWEWHPLAAVILDTGHGIETVPLGIIQMIFKNGDSES